MIPRSLFSQSIQIEWDDRGAGGENELWFLVAMLRVVTLGWTLSVPHSSRRRASERGKFSYLREKYVIFNFIPNVGCP
jgi:hypothetical protein